MKITYYGHSAFLVEARNIKALIDPFLSGNPQCCADINNITGITHIFITHGHSDHMGDTEFFAHKYGSLIICNYEIGTYLSSKGLDVHKMHVGGRVQLDFGTVKMTSAVHGSGIETEDGFLYGGNPGGYVISIGDRKIYHAGDTGLTMDMKLLQDEKIDAALLPIGGNFTMDIEDAVKAVGFIKPKLTVPMHYSTFDLIKADPAEFKEKVKTAEVYILQPGESIEI